MGRFLHLCAGFTLLSFLVAQPASCDEFRGKWWHYYQRGAAYSDEKKLDEALSDLNKAVGKRGKDQRMARTYGMHFIDYFPHRELGIVHLAKGDVDAAIRELEESVRSAESAKAIYYLNAARKVKLSGSNKARPAPVEVLFESPKEPQVTRARSIRLKAKVTSDAFVSRVTVNGVNYPVEEAKREVAVVHEVSLDDDPREIRIVAEDLAGNKTVGVLPVTVKREGPSLAVSLISNERRDGKNYARVIGEVSDEIGIQSVRVGGRQVKTDGARSYMIDLMVERRGAQTLVVQAEDITGNETIAEVDLSSLIAQERVERQSEASGAREAAEKERAARETAETARLALAAAEQERQARAAAERAALELAEKERLARLADEKARQAALTAERERQAAEQRALLLAAAKVEQERQAREAAEQSRLAREKAEQEELARLKAEAESKVRAAADKARQERLAWEAAELNRLDREKSERQELARLKAEAESKVRMAAEHAEKVEAERLVREETERSRLAALKAEEERQARQAAELDRLAREKAEREELARLKAEAEGKVRLAAEKAEAERVVREKAERVRIAAEKAEQALQAMEAAERNRLASEKFEQEELARLKAEAQRRVRVAAEKAEAERVAREDAERSRIAAQKAEDERKLRLAAEKAEAEQREAAARPKPAAEKKDVLVEREKLKAIVNEQKLSLALSTDTDKQITPDLILSGEGTKVFTPAAVASANRPSPAPESASCGKPDREKPILNIKDPGDVPFVFVDAYPLDGMATDNCSVERVVVNGRDVSVRKGKQVYFSSIVKLESGENSISVDVYDAAGHKTSSQLQVSRKIPSVLQNGSRMSVLVLPFDYDPASSASVRLASDYLIGAMSEQRRFLVVERQKLKQLMAERKMSLALAEDNEKASEFGKIAAAEAIVVNTARETEHSFEVTSRIVDTETSEVMSVLDVYTEDTSAASVKTLMTMLAAKIARNFPVVEGIVISRDDDRVLTDLGAPLKVRQRTGAIIYRKGKEIKHPTTGKSLGWDTEKLGEGYLDEVQENFSKLRLGDRYRDKSIQPSDLVVTK